MKINIEPYVTLVPKYAARLQDVRVVGQAAFIVIVLLISWSGVKSIQTNYALQKEITGLSQQNDLQKLQNNNLKLGNDYYKSNQYLELSARQNFGLAAPGEKLMVVPKRVALAKTVNIPSSASTAISPMASTERNNFEAWVNFFLHRKPTVN